MGFEIKGNAKVIMWFAIADFILKWGTVAFLLVVGWKLGVHYGVL